METVVSCVPMKQVQGKNGPATVYAIGLSDGQGGESFAVQIPVGTPVSDLTIEAKKNIDSDKKLGLIPKEKMRDLIGRSPNHLDTYIMRGIFERAKKPATSLPTLIYDNGKTEREDLIY